MRRATILMWILVLCVWGWVISGSLAGQRPLDGPTYTGEREWARNYTRENGSVEHACSRTGEPIGNDETPNWHACNCRHRTCKAINGTDKEALEVWDARCAAKCSRSHCHCMANCHT